MEIDKLSKIIDLCRKKGVESIEIEGIKISLNPAAPLKRAYRKKSLNTNHEFTSDGPTDEELLMYSVQSHGVSHEGL